MLRKTIIIIVFLFASVGVMAQTAVSPIEAARGVTADQIIDEAVRHLGKPYHWGGKGPNAFDCAGFVRYVYGQFGVPMAPSCTPQYHSGIHVETFDLQRGDLVFFGGSRSSRSIGHVGIVTEVDHTTGTYEFIHAARDGIRFSRSNEDYYRSRYICACRILTTDPSTRTFYLPDSIALDLYFPETSALQSSFYISVVDTIRLGISDGALNISEQMVDAHAYEIDDIMYGQCLFGYNVHCMGEDSAQVRTMLTQMRDTVDILIVSFQSSDDDLSEAWRFTHWCVDLGADVVCCFGSEVSHMIERYNGRLIAYGLGNHCHPQAGRPAHSNDNVMLKLDSDGSLIRGTISHLIHPQPSTTGDIKMAPDGTFYVVEN